MAAKKKTPRASGKSAKYSARRNGDFPVITFSLPRDIFDRLFAHAKRAKATRSQVVAEALREYLSRHE